jgi:transcriptional regulator with XRE-family HTH domain
MDFSILGSKIRQLRKENNLTQEALAEEIDLSYTYIGQVERGARGINLPNLIKIANRFGVSLDYLLSDYLINDISKERIEVDREWLEIIENKTPKEKQRYIELVKDISKYL